MCARAVTVAELLKKKEKVTDHTYCGRGTHTHTHIHTHIHTHTHTHTQREKGRERDGDCVTCMPLISVSVEEPFEAGVQDQVFEVGRTLLHTTVVVLCQTEPAQLRLTMPILLAWTVV